MLLKSVLTLLGVAASAFAAQGQLQPVTDFGPNPTNVGMFVYKPAKLAKNPPLIVAIHFCTGTAQLYFQATKYASLADAHGFIVVYPNAPDAGG